MKNLSYLLGLIVLMSFAACAPRVQFTQSIKDQHQLQESELKSIQFYTTGDIMLQRMEDSGSNKATNEGELVISSGSSLEQVSIPAGTPGVVEKVIDETKIAVRFEAGGDKTIVFGNTQQNKGAYYIIPSEVSEGKKIVNYDGKKYALSGNSQYVSLSFKMRKLNKFEKDQRVVKGVKL